jgi:flagellar biosynthesis protein FliR
MLPADLKLHLVLLGWGAARAMPIAWLIPAFGGPALPVQVRLALGLALSGLCLPLLSGHPPEAPGPLWPLLVARELVVGLVMGLACACWFRASEAAGRLVDAFRGAGSTDALSPVAGERSSPLASLMLLLAVLVFLEIGGVRHVALALERSYEAIPLSAQPGAPSGAMAAAVVLASGKLIESALGLCAPVLVSLVLADLLLGAIGRAVPQIPVQSLGVPLKALLGVGAVLLGLGGIEAALRGSLAGFLTLARAAIESGR